MRVGNEKHMGKYMELELKQETRGMLEKVRNKWRRRKR